MSEIINAKNVAISKKRVLFDTNIWIFINGFGANSAQHRADIYSDAYKALIRNENTIVLNDYVLGEFFNRCARMEYDLKKLELQREDALVPHFKEYRRSAEFTPVLESIRDTCLNMLDDCEFISVGGHHYDIAPIRFSVLCRLRRLYRPYSRRFLQKGKPILDDRRCGLCPKRAKRHFCEQKDCGNFSSPASLILETIRVLLRAASPALIWLDRNIALWYAEDEVCR